jgi:hypothetical protein
MIIIITSRKNKVRKTKKKLRKSADSRESPAFSSEPFSSKHYLAMAAKMERLRQYPCAALLREAAHIAQHMKTFVRETREGRELYARCARALQVRVHPRAFHGSIETAVNFYNYAIFENKSA